MEIFSALLALCEGKSPLTGEFPSQMPVIGWLDWICLTTTYVLQDILAVLHK